LEVLSRRADNYHEVQMIMLGVELYDKLTIKPGDSLSMTCDDPALPVDHRNLVIKATRAFEKKTGIEVKSHIDLEKNIPVAAGLGGGSSDAAAVLKGINFVYETGLNSPEMESLGAGLGADIPFFIKPGHKIARGIGEKLSPIALEKELYLVLINPGIGVSTAEIYRKIQLTSSKNQTNVPTSLKGYREAVDLLRNDLEPIVASDHQEIAEVKRFLLNSGAEGSMMSGSGPTVFGIFKNGRNARCVADDAQKKGWWAFSTSTLSDWK